jgi:hypothetical protein
MSVNFKNYKISKLILSPYPKTKFEIIIYLISEKNEKNLHKTNTPIFFDYLSLSFEFWYQTF